MTCTILPFIFDVMVASCGSTLTLSHNEVVLALSVFLCANTGWGITDRGEGVACIFIAFHFIYIDR